MVFYAALENKPGKQAETRRDQRPSAEGCQILTFDWSVKAI